MAKKKYTVTYERDEDGWWVAHIRGVKGCHTQGKNIQGPFDFDVFGTGATHIEAETVRLGFTVSR